MCEVGGYIHDVIPRVRSLIIGVDLFDIDVAVDVVDPKLVIDVVSDRCVIIVGIVGV